MAAVPSYDLYPNLSRRQANFVQRPTRANKQQRDFLAMNLVSSRQRWSNEEDPFWVEQPNEETPPWDLYPAILRRVSITKANPRGTRKIHVNLIPCVTCRSRTLVQNKCVKDYMPWRLMLDYLKFASFGFMVVLIPLFFFSHIVFILNEYIIHIHKYIYSLSFFFFLLMVG
jgi:hypothetical protein